MCLGATSCAVSGCDCFMVVFLSFFCAVTKVLYMFVILTCSSYLVFCSMVEDKIVNISQDIQSICQMDPISRTCSPPSPSLMSSEQEGKLLGEAGRALRTNCPGRKGSLRHFLVCKRGFPNGGSSLVRRANSGTPF